MATAPVWSLGPMPFGAEYAFNPTSTRVTRAKNVWDNPAGYTNTEWVTAGKAKYGTWDNYLKAIQDYSTAYANYVVKSGEERAAANPGTASAANNLKSAYLYAANFPGFTSSQQSKYQKLATQYENEYTTLSAQEDAAKAERTRLAELKGTANEVAGAIRQQASDRYGPALKNLVSTRDTLYKQINNAYNVDFENLQKAYQDDAISKGQYEDLKTKAEATFQAAKTSLFDQYDAARAAITKQYDDDYAYADSVKAGIANESLSPTKTYTVPKFTVPKIGAGVSYSPVELPKFEDVPYEEPVEEDPYAGMTLQEKIDAMSAATKKSIQESMDAATEAMDARLAETFGPGWNSAETLLAEMQKEPTLVTAKEAMDSGMAGFDGMNANTARNLARELVIFGNLGDITDPATGQPYEDPLDSLAASIWEKGYDTVLQDLQDQGITFRGAIPEGFITEATATPILQQLYTAGGYDPNSSNFADWNNFLQKNGLQATLDLWAESGNKGALTPEQIAAFDASAGLDDFYNLQDLQFQSNINTILQGADIRPDYGDLTAEDAITQAFTNAGKSIENNQSAFDDWVTYADNYGVDTALAKLNEQLSIYNEPSILDEIVQPQQAFESTGIFKPDFSGLTYSPEQEQYASTGIYQPTFAAPTNQAPTTGLPGVNYALPTTTLTPAPYTPPPLLAAAPERPTLNPNLEFIGAPGIDRGVPTPMEALTAQQAGSQFVSPTQEDYYTFFGYTPEQLNAAQYLAELEGAPRAGIAAQTVPVLPPAVTGAPAPTGMKEGGSVGGLKAVAQVLQSQGREGDTMLAHINPEEAAMLKAMGGSGTINPNTGLPEFKRIKLWNPFGSDITIGSKSSDLLRAAAVATAAPYLPAIGGSTAVTAGILSGVGTMLGGGSFQQGLQNGLMAGMASGMSSGAMGSDPLGVSGPSTFSLSGGPSSMGGGVGSQNVQQYAPSLESQNAIYNTGVNSSLLGKATDYLSNIPSAIGKGLSNMDWKDMAMLGYAGVGLAGLQENKQAQRDYDAYIAGLEAEQRRRKAAGTASFERAFAAKGGLMKLAGGGMTYAEGGGTTGPTNEPRMVKGTGDGMSDSVPATIEGVQEARLANDEFVIPADVVADIGNGSSSAGAKQLYSMMDRVRQARHGTTEQPPEIDVRKIMPA